METAAPAAATVDSATTQNAQVETPASPAFDAADQATWSAPQRENWNKTGEQPTKQDSAPAAKKAAPDSAPDKDKKNAADSASDSATDKSQQPHLKTPEDTAKRFKEILDDNKALQRRLESLERGERKTSDTRDTKQDSQPAADVYKPLDEKEFFKGNPAAGTAGHKTYEDFVRAAGRHEGEWAARQAIAQENQRRATADAQKELAASMADAKKRYPDYDQRIQPAVQAITDKSVPFAVQAVINDSPAFADLMYVLGEPAALADLVATAKSNPAAAIRKIVLTEQLVLAELAKAKGAAKSGADDKGDDTTGDGKTRDASGKFVSDKKDAAAEPKPRAPKPPTEVGGRGTAPDDALREAAKANDFKAFEAEEWRRKRASAS